jgi:hypothetical protein
LLELSDLGPDSLRVLGTGVCAEERAQILDLVLNVCDLSAVSIVTWDHQRTNIFGSELVLELGDVLLSIVDHRFGLVSLLNGILALDILSFILKRIRTGNRCILLGLPFGHPQPFERSVP